MIITLKQLKPNPFRDFKVDPVDQHQVKRLVKSINDYGFWGGAVCRHGKNGDIEVVAGWTRVQAGIEAGIKTADLFVGDFDGAATARAYAMENATQRGNTATAIAGSVASAITLLARAILLGGDHLPGIHGTSPKAWETARGHLASGRGIGEDLIEKFLEGVPGMTNNAIREQLASLKKSGDYQRIVTEVTNRIQEERAEAVKELERLEKEEAKAHAEADRRAEELAEARRRAKEAKEKAGRKEAEAAAKRAEADAKLADKRRAEFDEELKKFDALRTTRKAAEQVADYEPEFDLAGVSRHLTNANQVRAFRDVAFKKGVKPYLPVSEQARLAAELVKYAKRMKEELTGRFIEMNMMALLSEAKDYERKVSREERKAMEAADIRNKFERLVDDFARGCRTMMSAGGDLTHLMAKHRETTFRISDALVDTINYTRQTLDKLAAGLAKRTSSQKQQKILARLK
jgi:hypothetical protein